MTPVLLPEAVPDIMKMSFDSDSASGETDNIRVTDVLSDYSFFAFNQEKTIYLPHGKMYDSSLTSVTLHRISHTQSNNTNSPVVTLF